ncbi:UDP-N-acetylmuramoyl-L-alanyl-D-glutamate--2,6-diaminopimelate ligase [Candidatus Saccharibacteria bacterium]|nr:UDP-N-acetylmuramoyl-L-alanyl-D-glutamate--2,6-diaminopimelate ligase [Candidatus Saccharibacteria bacterium]
MKKFLEKIPFYNTLVLPYHFLQAILANLIYRRPAKNLHVIAVTGTNGKTTTCFMLWKILNHAGLKTGLMTTVAYGVDKLKPELNHMTTVDAFTLNKRIKALKKEGAKYLVLETTSHALAEYRTLGIPIEIAVFTNLTHEHLDYHKTFAKYRKAKGKLFKKAKFSIINADDKNAKFYEKLSKNYASYGIKTGKNRPENLKLLKTGVKYSLHDITYETKIPGEFNVYNSLAAILTAEKLNVKPGKIREGLLSLDSVEGRMNIVDEGQPFTVIVDYAHAPDALEKVFTSLPKIDGKIISVHGGAGRRDPSTRAPRGEILGQHSDIVIITEDDSRDEDPEKIAESFIKGAEKAGKVLNKNLFKELDRKKAIALALKTAKKGDVVLILGKGHEKSILRADGPHPFEDLKVTRELLKSL